MQSMNDCTSLNVQLIAKYHIDYYAIDNQLHTTGCAIDPTIAHSLAIVREKVGD